MSAEDVKVLEVAAAVMSRALDELVGACIGDDGKPKAPDRGALMRARSMLPPACKHALKKIHAELAQPAAVGAPLERRRNEEDHVRNVSD